ncbi:DUF6056 family protein [Listeria costaricensis]|uniref:DUF6056 family protein n=1 Tax=Listeria costaricensis TaxID=2026604 RepID=UPI000C08AA47|nr:DUF6056 family protein [Listeria costaricensis]
MLKKMKENKSVLLAMGLIFLFYLFMAYNVPLTGDDWTWGSQVGLDRLESFYKDYNGRYLSNSLEVILTRFFGIRVVFMAVVNTALIFLSAKLISNKKRTSILSILIVFLCFMLIPTDIFKQTFGWVAGFVNYNFSLVLLLIYLVIIKNIFGEEKPYYKKYLSIFILILGFFTQLNVEHVSLFANFTAVFVIIIAYIRFKKIYAVHISYLVGTILGSLLMFTNGAYLNILLHSDGYRNIDQSQSFMQKLVDIYTNSMHYFLFENNQWIVLLLAIIISSLLMYKNVNWIVRYIVSLVLIGYSILIVCFKVFFSDYMQINIIKDAFTLLSVLYFIALIIGIIFIFKGMMKVKVLYFISGIILMSAPFIVISPYGARCALAPFLCMVLIIGEGVNLIEELSSADFSMFIKLLIIVNIAFGVCYSGIMFANGHTNRSRLDYLHEQVNKGAQSINIMRLPFPQFCHMPDPEPNQYQTETFRIVNKVPEDTQLNLIPFALNDN